MADKPQPRNSYTFGEMKRNEVKQIKIVDGDEGAKALCAAYAYGRRNGKKFCGATEASRKYTYMLIRRIA